jgi:hypothetical protein
MKTWHLFLGLVFCAFISCSAQEKSLLIDDFEIPISGGPDGTVDSGSGGGSALEVTGATDIKYTGQQSIKIVYDAVPGGYMWIARGFDLDAKNAAWLIRPEDIDWSKFNALSFYMYGSDSKANIAFDIKDNGFQIWRFMVEDNFVGWKKIVCPFNEFFVRGDWQPNNADKNATLDFPLKSFQFEPLPEAKGTLYFDSVELVSK